MPKLVRDFIPALMSKTDKPCNFYQASHEEYGQRLKEKLIEEVYEYIKDESIEELADILEVVEAIIKFKGFKKNELLDIQNNKKQTRGGFSERMVLA